MARGALKYFYLSFNLSASTNVLKHKYQLDEGYATL
jgi:hypothetical protein